MWVEGDLSVEMYHQVILEFKKDIATNFRGDVTCLQLHDIDETEPKFCRFSGAYTFETCELLFFKKTEPLLPFCVCDGLAQRVNDLLSRHVLLKVAKRSRKCAYSESSHGKGFDQISLKIVTLHQHATRLKRNAQRRTIYAWCICAKRFGVCRDVRMIVTKLITDPL